MAGLITLPTSRLISVGMMRMSGMGVKMMMMMMMMMMMRSLTSFLVRILLFFVGLEIFQRDADDGAA